MTLQWSVNFFSLSLVLEGSGWACRGIKTFHLNSLTYENCKLSWMKSWEPDSLDLNVQRKRQVPSPERLKAKKILSQYPSCETTEDQRTHHFVNICRAMCTTWLCCANHWYKFTTPRRHVHENKCWHTYLYIYLLGEKKIRLAEIPGIWVCR